jgi:hypothetical protein
MNHTSKMVLVPESAYSTLLSSKIEEISPLIFELTRLDEQLEKILRDPTLAPDVKYIKYEQLLRRHKQLKWQQNKPDLSARSESPPPPAPVNVPANVVAPPLQQQLQQQQQQQQQQQVRQLDPNILSTLPATYLRAGQMLVDAIEKDDIIQWDNNNQLIFNGQPIRGSNLLDLVHDFSKKPPNRPMAKGAKEFAQLLKQANVPLAAIGSKDRRDLLKSPPGPPEPVLGVQQTPFRTPPTNSAGFQRADQSPWADDSFTGIERGAKRYSPRTITNSNRKNKKGQTGRGSDRFNIYHW